MQYRILKLTLSYKKPHPTLNIPFIKAYTLDSVCNNVSSILFKLPNVLFVFVTNKPTAKEKTIANHI